MMPSRRLAARLLSDGKGPATPTALLFYEVLIVRSPYQLVRSLIAVDDSRETAIAEHLPLSMHGIGTPNHTRHRKEYRSRFGPNDPYLLFSSHSKPGPQSLQPLSSTNSRPAGGYLHHLRDLLQQQRPIQRIHLPVLPIPQTAVIEFVRVVRFHQGDGLLELIEILLEDRVLERGDEGGEEVDVDT